MRISWAGVWRDRRLLAFVAFTAMRKGPRRFWRWLTVDLPWILDEDAP